MRKTGLLVVPALLLLPAITRRSQTETEAYFNTALAGLRWIEAHGVPAEEGGTLYPNVPGDPGSPLKDLSLYHGQAGRVLGFLQAAAATNDPALYLTAARALQGMEAEVARAVERDYRDAGLYTGLAGVAAIYLRASNILRGPGPVRARAQALSLADSILAWALIEDSGRHWNGMVDIISGAAGTGLFLLEAYEATGDSRYLKSAGEAGRWLIDAGRRDGDTLYWPIGGGNETHYPNFAHGTAGVGFFLGRLAEEGSPIAADALSARTAGLEWLKAHGETEGCVVFHHEGGGEELQYVSWCHGPVGTGRLFLHEATLIEEGDPARQRALEPAIRGAEYLLQLGVEPGESPSGYWNNVSVCCGTAGILRYLLDLYLATGDLIYLDGARSCGDVLVQWAAPDGDGVKWPQAEHRVRPDFVQAQTGEMQGAAGICVSLLRLYLIETGRPELILRLPDEVSIPL